MRRLILLVVMLIGSVFGGLALIVGLDFMARGFGWVGVDSPSTGWLLLGVLGGALVGLTMGLRRAGRPISGRQIAAAAVGLAAILSIASAGLPESRAGAATGGDGRGTVQVLTEELNMRAAPDVGSAIVGRATRGQLLRVLEVSETGDWYRVETGGSKGWVGARFVSAPDR